MSAGGFNSRRRRRGDRAAQHAGAGMERWLLTYSDLITLLMALFIIMWGISAVDTGKYNDLKQSLKVAFSGKIFPNSSEHVLDGDRSILNAEGLAERQNPSSQSEVQTTTAQLQEAAESQDLENLRRIQQEIEAYAQAHGFRGRLRTSIDERGLVIRLLTDEVLFDTGKAVLKGRSLPLLGKIAQLLTEGQIVNPVRVEGNTDDVPIFTFQFRSNWELSTARATAVLQQLLGDGLPSHRLSVAGYADQRPVATNATGAGRRLNRRVDLVVLRRSLGPLVTAP